MLTRTRNELLIVAAIALGAFVVGTGYLHVRGAPLARPSAPEVRVTSDVVEGDHCPELTSWVASPLRTSVGGWIDVGAAARDVDPGQILTYSWEPADSFVEPHRSATRYQCGKPGARQLLLNVSDNARPIPCLTRLSLRVECVER